MPKGDVWKTSMVPRVWMISMVLRVSTMLERVRDGRSLLASVFRCAGRLITRQKGMGWKTSVCRARAKCPVAPMPQRERELHKDGGGGGGGGVARRARAARAPTARSYATCHVLRHVLRHALRRVLHVPVLHVSPKGSMGGGMRVSSVGSAAGKWRVPQLAPSLFRPPRRLGSAA